LTGRESGRPASGFIFELWDSPSRQAFFADTQVKLGYNPGGEMNIKRQEDDVVKSVGVVGAGTMGSGIAQSAARAGLAVIMRDVSDDFLKRGLSTIDKSLQRDVDKQRLAPDEKQEIIARIRPTTGLESLREVDLVVEAITEDFAVKSELFRQLDQVA
jgi:NADPH-dependent 2,4-dienoyl-CoA reductase/sulfur reductase-like enzyme